MSVAVLWNVPTRWVGMFPTFHLARSMRRPANTRRRSRAVRDLSLAILDSRQPYKKAHPRSETGSPDVDVVADKRGRGAGDWRCYFADSPSHRPEHHPYDENHKTEVDRSDDS